MKLLDLYIAEVSSHKTSSEKNAEGEEVESNNSLLETKIMQVLSSAVRNHEAAEKILCMNTNSVKVIESGLGLKSEYETTFQPDSALKRKSLFFLQALVTSDSADFCTCYSICYLPFFRPCRGRKSRNSRNGAINVDTDIGQQTKCEFNFRTKNFHCGLWGKKNSFSSKTRWRGEILCRRGIKLVGIISCKNCLCN